MRAGCLAIVMALGMIVSSASAQQFPPPVGPVVFCGEQTLPEATSYRLIFNGGSSEALAMDETTDAACPSGSTHSFRLAAERFTVGQHELRVEATNAFGTTLGPVYTVTVGIAPGPFTITAVISPGG